MPVALPNSRSRMRWIKQQWQARDKGAIKQKPPEGGSNIPMLTIFISGVRYSLSPPLISEFVLTRSAGQNELENSRVELRNQ